MDEVATVTYKSKEEWKLEMSQYNSSFGTVFENYEDNPLLDSFTVTVKDAKDLPTTTESIKKIEKVDSANYGEGAIDTIVSVFDVIEKATVVIMIALIFVTAAAGDSSFDVVFVWVPFVTLNQCVVTLESKEKLLGNE